MLSLTQDQIDHYHTQGYLILRASEHKLVRPSNLQAWTDDVAQWPRERGKSMPNEQINSNGQRQLMRTEKLVDYHPESLQLLCGPGIAHILKPLTATDMLLFKAQIN